MLKGVGICLVIAGCSGMGWYMAERHALRIRMLNEFEQALQFLYGEIEYAGCDMVELFDKLAFRGGYFAPFWLQMSGKLRSYDGVRFWEHWCRELPKISGYQNLQEEDLEILLGIGANLGNLDRQTQLHTIQIFQKRLQEVIVTARQEYRGKAKVSCVIGITAGIFLALLLI
ncbi:MAG: stage III sporulation protein AB [Butyribacter sp.]|nr:stage III sporulation protein AB [bacterium]MDY3854372.1 stage III sporulation protein AB [Butyribacter sp.]